MRLSDCINRAALETARFAFEILIVEEDEGSEGKHGREVVVTVEVAEKGKTKKNARLHAFLHGYLHASRSQLSIKALSGSVGCC